MKIKEQNPVLIDRHLNGSRANLMPPGNKVPKMENMIEASFS
jgi:hypothetical protein